MKEGPGCLGSRNRRIVSFDADRLVRVFAISLDDLGEKTLRSQLAQPIELWVSGSISDRDFLSVICKSDVVVVAQKSPLTPEQAFQLGIAVALDKPIIQFGKSSAPLLSVGDTRVQQANSISSLVYAIDQIAKAVAMERKRPTRAKSITERQRRAAEAFATSSDWSSITPPDYEHRVLDLLKSTGADSIVTRYSQSTWFDMAIWDRQLERTVGNPVMIEAKITITEGSLKSISEKSAQLGPTYSKALVILLFLDGVIPLDAIRREAPRTVAINSVALAQDLQHYPLASALQRRIKTQIG